MRRCALIVAACMLAGSAGAMADAVTVTANRLNLRAGASADSRSLGIVTSGQKLTYISEEGQWVHVKTGGREAYVMSDYVSIARGSVAADVSATVKAASAVAKAKTRVNMRALPNTFATIVRVVAKDDTVNIMGTSGGWYRVSYNGAVGYVRAEYFDASTVLTPEEAASAAAVSTEGRTTARVNLRFAPSAGAAVVAIIEKNADVAIMGEEGSWYKVSAEGHIGYIAKAYVNRGNLPAETVVANQGVSAAAAMAAAAPTGTTETIAAQPGTATAVVTVAETTPNGSASYAQSVKGKATTRVNLREGASTASRVLVVVPRGAEVTLLGEAGTWYHVNFAGRIGYVAKNYVTMDAGATVVPVQSNYEQWTAETTVVVNLRKAPEGDVLSVLNAGTEVTVLGQNGAWYMVSVNGAVGYLASTYATKKAGSTTAKPTETPTAETGVTAYITGGSVNVRTGPGIGYGVVTTLRTGTQITIYSLSGGWYKMTVGSMTGYVSSKYVTRTPVGTVTTLETTPNSGTTTTVSTGRVIASDWWTGEISTVFARGDVGQVTDVDTGLSFYVKRTGGINHLDAQPLTSADTAIMFRIYGNKWKWDRRAIWVTIDGKTYAASMNGMPHGSSDSMPDNNFDGCFCIHFTNSRTHEGNRLDAAHQAAVKKALAAGNK